MLFILLKDSVFVEKTLTWEHNRISRVAQKNAPQNPNVRRNLLAKIVKERTDLILVGGTKKGKHARSFPI